MSYYTDIDIKERIVSYDYIENFISDNVKDWSQWNKNLGTDEIESLFSDAIQRMDNKEFEFLILHCGYIPDYYGKDSSQETLYSKLVESLVCEWAKRVGFTESFLQKQKSNKEDITIKKGNKVIVCDAKSFRLGRSQAAPNVKDTIKKQAYSTWLAAYNSNCRIGGLTTFPSMHNWKKGGEAYLYYTEGDPAIMILFYEHLSFILNQSIGADKIIEVLNNYNQVFTSPSRDQSIYWNGIIRELFGNSKEYTSYMLESKRYIKEKVLHAKNVIEKKLQQIDSDVDAYLNTISDEELRAIAKKALYINRAKELHEQLNHIEEFRLNK